MAKADGIVKQMRTQFVVDTMYEKVSKYEIAINSTESTVSRPSYSSVPCIAIIHNHHRTDAKLAIFCPVRCKINSSLVKRLCIQTNE